MGIDLNSNNSANARIVEKYLNTAFDTVQEAVNNLPTFTSAEANLKDFNNRYYGPLAVEPTTKPDGSAMAAGDLYYDIEEEAFKHYTNNAWGFMTSSVSSVEITTIGAAHKDGTNTVVNVAADYSLGTNSIIVFINGDIKVNTTTSAVRGVYVETSSNVITFPNLLLDDGDIVTILVSGTIDNTDPNVAVNTQKYTTTLFGETVIVLPNNMYYQLGNNNLEVFINGALTFINSEYFETSTTSITLPKTDYPVGTEFIFKAANLVATGNYEVTEESNLITLALASDIQAANVGTTKVLGLSSLSVIGDNKSGIYFYNTLYARITADGVYAIDPTVAINSQGTGVGTGCWVKHNMDVNTAFLDDGRSVQANITALNSAVNQNKAVLIVAYGQSNARGRFPKVSSSYPNTFTFVGGSRKGDDTASQANIQNPVKGEDMYSLVAFSEFGRNEETICPGFAEQSLLGNVSRVYAYTAAVGSMHWRELRPDTALWSTFVQSLQQFKILANADGYTDLDYVIYWDQGEAEADDIAPGNNPTDTPITQAQFVTLLEDVHTNMSAVIDEVSGNTNQKWTMLLAPLNNAGVLNDGSTSQDVQNAQLEFSLKTDNAYLIGGKSQMVFESDTVHLTGASVRYMGEQAGEVYTEVSAGNLWTPLYITSATRVGTAVTANCSLPVAIDADILDTAPYATGTKLGAEFFSDGIQVPISTLTVTGSTINITLTSTPVGSNNVLKIAQQIQANNNAATVNQTRTSLRSASRMFSSPLTGIPLYNFMVPHNVEVM